MVFVCKSTYIDPLVSFHLYLQFGQTPILQASQNGHRDVVQLLIEYGADVGEVSSVCIVALEAL